MLEKSNNDLPYNIVLLEIKLLDELDGCGLNLAQNSKKVVGHSRICRVHNQSRAAFVESGIVLNNLYITHNNNIIIITRNLYCARKYTGDIPKQPLSHGHCYYTEMVLYVPVT